MHTRVETVRVDVGTLKEECKLALSRKQISTQSEIGRQCDRVLVQKNKRKECIQRIVEFGQETGVAGITLLWSETVFLSYAKTLVAVALEAIAAVSRLKTVCVLYIHNMTCLFPYPIF